MTDLAVVSAIVELSAPYLPAAWWAGVVLGTLRSEVLGRA